MSEADAEPVNAGHPLLHITKGATERRARRWRALRAAVVGAVGTFAVLGAGQLGAPPMALALLAAAAVLAIATLLDRGAHTKRASAAPRNLEGAGLAVEPRATATPPHPALGAAALMHDLRAPLLTARHTRAAGRGRLRRPRATGPRGRGARRDRRRSRLCPRQAS